MHLFEHNAYQSGYSHIAGVDEAGRGPLAGPVVAAAVILPRDYRNGEIKDSKQLTPRKREKLYGTIKEEAVAVGLGVVEPAVIDAVNIFQATLLAMREAALDLSLPPDYLLIDGRNGISLALPQKPIVKGDALSISIASASIIAKVSRDKIMELYHRQFPHYNFAKNKGYGTEEHREAIRRYGLCRIHRRTFRIKEDGPCPLRTGDLFPGDDLA
jgi:ribonuclease HII